MRSKRGWRHPDEVSRLLPEGCRLIQGTERDRMLGIAFWIEAGSVLWPVYRGCIFSVNDLAAKGGQMIDNEKHHGEEKTQEGPGVRPEVRHATGPPAAQDPQA